MNGKRVADSETVVMHIPMPDESNASGPVHGGFVFKHIDDAAGLTAQRHARADIVTASIERMDFLTPIYPGELMILKASVNLAGRTSMEVGVRVEVEDLNAGEVRHAATCYLTCVAVDKDGRPTEIPPLIIESEDEHRRQQKAQARRQHRQSLRQAEASGGQ